MASIVLIIHLFLALAIIGLVLLQRSEGGGLGIGGGGGMGALAGAQTTANILTRATAVCAGLFFVTSLLLGIIAGNMSGGTSILDRLDQPPAATAPEEAGKDSKPEAPASKTPTAPIAE